MTTSDPDVEAEIDRLYQAPLSDFIAVRNALATRLKSGGDKDGAARVRALARPNLPAWAVNQAYWTARPEFDAFLAATQGLRRAQAEGAAGAELREAMTKRRGAQAVLGARAASLLVAAGHGASGDTPRRVSDILEAVAATPAGSVGARVQPGRLTSDLEPPGFEAIGAFVRPASPSPSLDRRPPADAARPPRPRLVEPRPRAPTEPDDDRPDDRAIALERARAALAETERALERVRREAREAEDARSAVEKRGQQARDELAEATLRYQGAQERAVLAAATEATARDEASRRAAVRVAAEAAHEAALRAVRELA